MPRSYGSSRSRSSSPSSPRSSFSSQSLPQPQQIFEQGPVQKQNPSILEGIASTIVQSMVFIGGSEISHQVVRSMMGGSSHQNNQPQQNFQKQQVIDIII